MKFVAYYRVSTKRQGDSGLGLAAQRTAVEAFAQYNLGEIVGEYTEIETGKRSDRPNLAGSRPRQGRERNSGCGEARPAG